MPLNKNFLTGLAKLSVLILFLIGAVSIPLGSFLIGLSCLALRVVGWFFLAVGVFSLGHFLRLLACRLFR